MTVLIQFYLQNSRWAGFGPQVIVHWCILSRYTNTDSLNNYSNFSCALLGFNPIYLDGFFFFFFNPVLICFPHFCLETSLGWGTYAYWSHSTVLFLISAYFSVCHQLTLFPIPSLNLTLIMLDNDKLFFKGVEPVYMSVSCD